MIVPKEAIANGYSFPSSRDLTDEEMLKVVQVVRERLAVLELHFASKVLQKAREYRNKACSWICSLRVLLERSGLDARDLEVGDVSELREENEDLLREIGELHDRIPPVKIEYMEGEPEKFVVGVQRDREIAERAREFSEGPEKIEFEGPLYEKPIVSVPPGSCLGRVHSGGRPVRSVKNDLPALEPAGIGSPDFPETQFDPEPEIDTVGELGRDTPAAMGDFDPDTEVRKCVVCLHAFVPETPEQWTCGRGDECVPTEDKKMEIPF